MNRRAKTFAKKTIAMSLAFALAWSPAQAGFMEDFYNSAGAGVNVTPADVYNTQALGVITGGGLVWRTPQRNFTPFYFSPPSLRSGCGGIDVFLGAFGLANREQFVQFLRNIGQNAAGLAFKVALQAMAPELESKIQEVANYINEWNRHFGNSCQAAKALMDAGPSQWIKEQAQRAKLAMTASGAASDYSEAERQTNTNGETVINNAPVVTNNAGKTINAPELNVLWSAFNSGTMGLSDSEKELMMALVGTTIFRKQGSGEDATIQPDSRPSIVNLQQLVGDPTQATESIPTYRCDDNDKCLNPAVDTRTEKSFSRLIYEKAKGLRDAIISRSAPNQNDMKLLTVTTSIPIYKIVQISAMPSRQYFGDDLIRQYSMAVAWEIASRYIEDLSRNIDKMLIAASEQDISQEKVKQLQVIQTRLGELRREMKAERDEIYQQITKNGSLIQQIEHIERVLYGNLSAQIASNLRFGR